MKNTIYAIDDEMIECNADCIIHSANCGNEGGGMQSVVINENNPISEYIIVENNSMFMSLVAIDPGLALFLDPVASKIFI